MLQELYWIILLQAPAFWFGEIIREVEILC